MKKLIISLLLLTSVSYASSFEPVTLPKDAHFIPGPYLVTLHVEVQKVGSASVVKSYSGMAHAGGPAYFAAIGACRADGNSEEACKNAWISELDQEGARPLRQRF